MLQKPFTNFILQWKAYDHFAFGKGGTEFNNYIAFKEINAMVYP